MRALIKLLLEYILIFLFFFILIDFLISNTVLNLKGKSCIKFEETFVELKKNCNGKEKIRPFLPTVSIFTDSNGLRVKNKYKQEIKEDKVFVFGSSFIYGAGLNYEQSVIGILEKEHKNYEFNNYSMPWGSPTFHLYRLKEKILEGEIPKKIILVLSMSDIHNETSIWKDYDNFGKPVLINKDIYKQSQIKEKFYKKHFRLTRSIALNLRNKIRSIKNKNIAISENNNKVRTTFQAGYTYTPLKELEEFYTEKSFNSALKKIKKRVDEMIVISSKNNIEFYLVIFPFADTLEYGQGVFNWEKFAAKLCPDKKCKFVNSFPDYLNYKNKNNDWYEKLFFVGDEHFTYYGHDILAEKFTNQIF